MADTEYIGLSLFSGVGMLDEAVGLALAGRGVGYRTAAFCEWETGAASTLLARMEESSLEPCPVFCGDLADFPAESFAGHIDIVTAGYPCQPYSVAGKQRGLADARALGSDGQGPVHHMLRIIGAVRPGLVFLENVGEALKHFRGIGRELEGLGYAVAPPLIIGADDVGASHRRKRMFVLAYRNLDGFGQFAESRARESWNDSDAGDAEVAQPSIGGLGELRKSSGGDGQSDGGYAELANAQREPGSSEHEHEARRRQGEGPGHGAVSREVGEPMGDAKGDHEQRDSQSISHGKRSADRGSGRELADAEDKDWRCQRQPGESPDDGRARSARNGGEELADSGSEHERPGNSDQAGSADDGGRGGEMEKPGGKRFQGIVEEGAASQSAFGRCGGRIFAPGPGDRSAWERTLSDAPHLAPAIEPSFRVLADGVAYVVDTSRADQLRACGNGVVAIQGAVAFELALREVERWERGNEVDRK